MVENPFRDFLNSFDKTYDLTISDEELQEKFERMNEWFQTLAKEEVLEKAHEVQDYLTQAISRVEEQRDELGKQLQTNKKKAKANRSYVKF